MAILWWSAEDDFTYQARLVCGRWVLFYLVYGVVKKEFDRIGVGHGIVFGVIVSGVIGGTVFVVCQLVDVIWLLVIVVGAASGGAIWIVALAQDRGCFSWAVGETEVSLDGGDDIVGCEFVREGADMFFASDFCFKVCGMGAAVYEVFDFGLVGDIIGYVFDECSGHEEVVVAFPVCRDTHRSL